MKRATTKTKTETKCYWLNVRIYMNNLNMIIQDSSGWTTGVQVLGGVSVGSIFLPHPVQTLGPTQLPIQ
jgi:hypothetical protein